MKESVRTTCTIEARVLDSGDVEVLLERGEACYRDSKLHRELFILTDSEETRLFVAKLKRMEAAW